MKSLEDLPQDGQLIIAYKSDNTWYPARYKKVLTWKGYKYKFVNLLSSGFWHDDVVGWNRIPHRTETLD